jgi:hypothetical protein
MTVFNWTIARPIVAVLVTPDNIDAVIQAAPHALFYDVSRRF